MYGSFEIQLTFNSTLLHSLLNPTKHAWLLFSLHSSEQMHQISLSFSCSWLLQENWHDFWLWGDWTCEGKLSCEDGMDSVCTITLPAPSQLSQCLGHAMHKRKARSNIEIIDIWNPGQRALIWYLLWLWYSNCEAWGQRPAKVFSIRRKEEIPIKLKR